MSKYLGSLVLVLVAVACGGSTDIGEESGGGTAPGGSNGDAGKGSGGSSTGGTAGKATGGSVSNAGRDDGGRDAGGRDAGGRDAGGAAGFGGTIIIVGGYGGIGTGGTGIVDERCPARQPMGACTVEEAPLTCQYDYAGCLCYPQAPNVYSICQKVDPVCPMAAPPPPDADPGVGGFSTKIALPPRLVCRCSVGTWLCTYGP